MKSAIIIKSAIMRTLAIITIVKSRDWWQKSTKISLKEAQNQTKISPRSAQDQQNNSNNNEATIIKQQ